MLLNPYIKSFRKPQKPEAWMRFPWEEDECLKKAQAGEYRLDDEDIGKLEMIREEFYKWRKSGTYGQS